MRVRRIWIVAVSLTFAVTAVTADDDKEPRDYISAGYVREFNCSEQYVVENKHESKDIRVVIEASWRGSDGRRETNQLRRTLEPFEQWYVGCSDSTAASARVDYKFLHAYEDCT